MLTSSVLVLIRSFFPIHVTTLRRAFCMLYSGIARAVDSEYRTYDFENWADIPVWAKVAAFILRLAGSGEAFQRLEPGNRAALSNPEALDAIAERL